MGDPSPNSGKEPPEGQLCAGPEQAGQRHPGRRFFQGDETDGIPGVSECLRGDWYVVKILQLNSQ